MRQKKTLCDFRLRAPENYVYYNINIIIFILENVFNHYISDLSKKNTVKTQKQESSTLDWGGGGLTKINTITPMRLLLSPGAIDVYQEQTIVSEFPTPRMPKCKTAAAAAFVCKSDACEDGRTITTADRDDKSKKERQKKKKLN